jgi:hypothetical protein
MCYGFCEECLRQLHKLLLTPHQCYESGSASRSAFASNKNQDPDPHRSDMLDPESDPHPHQFADDKPKRLEYELILALFQGFEPSFGSKESHPHQINRNPVSLQGGKSNPNPDPDLYQWDAHPQH